MTLRQDLERFVAVTRADPGDVDRLVHDEHQRFRAYEVALAAAPAATEGEIVALVLRDPDRVMAESALVGHVDRRASGLPSARSFEAWADTIARQVDQHSFLARRVREWRLFKRVMDGEDIDPADLGSASNWLQRKVLDDATSAGALTALGEVGRTKRVRNLARTRAGRVRRNSAP